MKHTKYFIIPLFIFSAIISSCSKEDFSIENNESAIDAGKKSGGKANSFYEEGLPKIKFIPKGEGKNIYTIALNDHATTTTVSVNGRIRYQDQSSARAIEGSNDVAFTIEDFKSVGKAPKVAFPSPVENKILNVYLEYREGDVLVNTFEYSLFVFADGSTAFQKPEIIFKKNEPQGISFPIILSGYSVDGPAVDFSIIIKNDPAEVVSAIKVLFDEKTSSPAPESYTNYLKTKAKFGQSWIFSGIIPFTENPLGNTFTLQISLLDQKGNHISQLDNVVTKFTKPNFGKEGTRIHALRIKETNKGSEEDPTYEMAALVLNIKQDRLGYVEIKFNEPFAGPKPLNNTLKLRKRPEILYQEWDQLTDDYITEIQNNPLFNGEYGTEFNPLFEKSAVGYTYSVSAAIYDKNGKQIGNPQTFNVTVEGETDESEPVIQSTRLFSSDGGKTWNYEAVIEDKGQSIEKVQVEFEKPIDGPTLLINPIGLTQVAEKEGNIKIYSGKVEFNSNPEGFVYIATIYIHKRSEGGYGDTVVARAPVSAGITHEYH